jgi:2-oxoisovalerate dehydrogenase E1 component alpha subunit
MARDCNWNFYVPQAGWSRCRHNSTSQVNTVPEIVAAWHNSRMTMVAEFEIRYRQILDARGAVVGPLPAFATDSEALLRMYRAMVLVRSFDAKAVNLQRTGQLGTYPSCLGHEATHVGVGAAMATADVLAPVYREFGTQLWRGVTMTEILAYWGGDERGNDFAVPRGDFAWCVPIATQTLHAAGAAMAFKILKQPRVAVAYIGDGGTSEGAFSEALNLAGARQLPVVFVIVNNGWAISVPVAAQTAAQTLAQKAVAAGIPGVQIDGNDIFAVRQVVGEALDVARRGAGPTVIEALTYRLGDHTTADDASRYRGEAEVKEAWTLEPLIRIRAFLMNAGIWDAAKELSLLEECAVQVDAAVSAYFASSRQSTDAMFEHLFAVMPAHLLEQRATALKYSAKSSGH